MKIQQEITSIMNHLQKPLVAVVNDDPYILAIYRTWIQAMGCNVQVFENGEDFLVNASRDSACVLLNEAMPRLSGSQTFHRMRRDGWHIPVISESGFPAEDVLERYGRSQIAHLQCPMRPAEMEEAIRKALRAAGYCLPPKAVVALEPDLLTWSGGAILQLTRSISEERAFANLPVLGDALEEAGCTNADILNHCRQPSEHGRGCWVLDRVYGLLLPNSRFDVIVCSECKQHLRVPNHLGELEVQCPRCKHRFDWLRAITQLFVG